MSMPKNQHHVSQCHSRSFFNEQEGRIYCYDKELDNFYYKTTTKSLFSEDFSNTRITDGQLDHKTLEEQLRIHFENDFRKHAANVVNLAEDPTKNGDSKLMSLYYLAAYALISDARFPDNKRRIDDAHDHMLMQTAEKLRILGDEEQARAIEDSHAENQKSQVFQPR